MDLFYRDFDSGDRIRSGALHLSAAAAWLAVSIVLSLPQLPDALWSEVKGLLTVDALWGLCIVLAGWVIATVIGGMVGLAVNGLLIAYGVVELWDQLKDVAGSVKRWLTAAYYAGTQPELAEAGKHFAAALSSGGLTLLELLITHRVFRAVEGRLRQAIPTPEWLRSQYEDAVQKRERTRKKPNEVARKVADGAGALRGPGAKRVAEGIPTEALVVAGLALGMATIGGVALLASSASGRR